MDAKELLKSDEGKAAVAAAVAAATEGLKTKNSDLLGKVQTLTERMEKFDGIDPSVYAGLVEFKKEIDDKRRRKIHDDGDQGKIIEQMKNDHEDLQKKFDALTEDLGTAKGTIRNQKKAEVLGQAMDKANIIGTMREAFADHLDKRISITGEGDELKVVVGDKSVGDFITEYVETDVGKHFVQADNNSGTGSPGSGDTKPLSKNPLKDEGASLTDLGSLMRTDPTKAKAMMKEAGLEVIE